MPLSPGDRLQHAALAILVASALPAPVALADVPSHRIVALSGKQVSGEAPGIVFDTLAGALISADGKAAFSLLIDGPGVTPTNRIAFASERTGPVTLIARAGNQVVGLPAGVLINGFTSNWFINGIGETTYTAFLTGTGVTTANDYGIWSEGGGTHINAAREGDPAPGYAPGIVLGSMQVRDINDVGTVAIQMNVTGTGISFNNDGGIWIKDSGPLHVIAREGEQADGLPVGVNYLSVGSPLLNNLDQVLFIGTLDGTGVDDSNNWAAWTNLSGSIDLFAREGDPAPDTGPGVVFAEYFFFRRLSDAGHLSFLSELAGTGVDSTNDTGIWTTTSGSMELVAREGQQAPGTAPGVVFAGMSPTDFFVNNDADVIFAADLAGTGIDSTNDRGVWTNASGTPELLLRKGDPAPGTPAGVVFTDFGSRLALTDDGQACIFGVVDGPGVNILNAVGLWHVAPNGTVSLMLRGEDLIDVDEDPMVDDLRSAENFNQSPYYFFSEAGELVSSIDFADGSEAIIVTSLVPCPGDADGDNTIDIDDLNLVIGNFGNTGAPGIPGDVNLDGVVDVNDLNQVIGNFGDSCV